MSSRSGNPVATVFARAVNHWRRINASNAAAFEELGSPLSVMTIRLGLADTQRPWWARQYLRLWRRAYVRHGIALPLPLALRKHSRP